MTESEILGRISEIKRKKEEFEKVSIEMYTLVRNENYIPSYDNRFSSFLIDIENSLKSLRLKLADLRGE